jgi:hypothetical protein
MNHPFTQPLTIKRLLVLLLPVCFFSSQALAQTPTFPSASSCTSKDLTLTSAALPGTDVCNKCTAGASVTRTLNLSIYNKTGSTRTSFAFWGTLVVRNSDGSIASSTPIHDCGGPVISNDTTTLPFNQITYICGQSLTIKDLFLAWTDASPKSTCATINSATINPKCGTLDSIRINTGLNATFSVTNATCSTPGSINMTPIGGKAPYTFSWAASEGGAIPTGQSTNQNLTGLVGGKYTVTITDALNCTESRFTTVGSAAPVTAEAGVGFTKTCNSNTSGQQIGEASASGFTYSWSPTTGLSNSTISNPIANPTVTTIYTVTKTNTASGCTNTDNVTVIVNTSTPVVSAGNDFSKTCTSNTTGQQIGEASASGFTYSWLPITGLSNASISSPNANPTVTTTYTVTKTNTETGCTGTDDVTVTVNTTLPTVSAGDDFTKTCTSNATGKVIGEAAESGYTYSWSPGTGLSSASVSNPNANPTANTTYTLTKTNTATGCSATDAVAVIVTTTPPVAPGVCIVQPSLCGPTTGSVTITSPIGSDYQYSIDNGVNFQAGAVFSNLNAGSVTGIKVKQVSTGCTSTAVSCGASACNARLTTQTSTQDETQTLTKVEGPITLKAFPNPFTSNVKFEITASEWGKGTLEIFNMLGQKVKTVFQGQVLQGTNTFQVALPLLRSGQLVYVLTTGDKRITGKLLQLNQ